LNGVKGLNFLRLQDVLVLIDNYMALVDTNDGGAIIDNVAAIVLVAIVAACI
jgi:hypothetical protein